MKKIILTLIIIAELLVISATAMLIIENFNQKKQIKKNERIRILENNWEVSKKIISSYDPEFAKYTKDK